MRGTGSYKSRAVPVGSASGGCHLKLATFGSLILHAQPCSLPVETRTYLSGIPVKLNQGNVACFQHVELLPNLQIRIQV